LPNWVLQLTSGYLPAAQSERKIEYLKEEPASGAVPRARSFMSTMDLPGR
jgi:hypothetical protein